jgi:hypothetical protein
LKIQCGSNGQPYGCRRSHAAPADRGAAFPLRGRQPKLDQSRRRQERARSSGRSRALICPTFTPHKSELGQARCGGAARQFQFPESTDLGGRVKPHVRALTGARTRPALLSSRRRARTGPPRQYSSDYRYCGLHSNISASDDQAANTNA